MRSWVYPDYLRRARQLKEPIPNLTNLLSAARTLVWPRLEMTFAGERNEEMTGVFLSVCLGQLTLMALRDVRI